MSMNEVSFYASAYGGIPPAVINRAEEYLRIVKAKNTLHPNLETALSCIVVACRMTQTPINVQRLVSLSHMGRSSRGVEQTVRKIMGAINARCTLQMSCSSLCIRFGCAEIVDLVQCVYTEFCIAMKKQTNTNTFEKQAYDLDDPIYIGACMYACSQRAQLRMNRTKLVVELCINPIAFDRIVASVEMHCERSLNGSISIKRLKDPNDTSNEVTPTSISKKMTKGAQRAKKVVTRAIQSQKYTKRGTNNLLETMNNTKTSSTLPAKYFEWKKNVLEKRRKQREENCINNKQERI